MAKLLLAQVLRKKGLSKRKFAKILDVPYYSVFRYFRRGYDPKLSTLARWSKALSVKISDLIGE